MSLNHFSTSTKQKNDAVKHKGGTKLKNKIKKNNDKPKTQKFKGPSTKKDFKNYVITQKEQVKAMKDWKQQCEMYATRKEVKSMNTTIE